jgi:hypothetical protein
MAKGDRVATQIVYDDTVGCQQIIRRARFLAEVLDRKKIYIDDNTLRRLLT